MVYRYIVHFCTDLSIYIYCTCWVIWIISCWFDLGVVFLLSLIQRLDYPLVNEDSNMENCPCSRWRTSSSCYKHVIFNAVDGRIQLASEVACFLFISLSTEFPSVLYILWRCCPIFWTINHHHPTIGEGLWMLARVYLVWIESWS